MGRALSLKNMHAGRVLGRRLRSSDGWRRGDWSEDWTVGDRIFVALLYMPVRVMDHMIKF